MIAEAYGMVELSGACSLKVAFPGLRYPPRCVGFPLAPTRVRIHFVDRKKDVIKSGGYSIFSREVEAEMLTNEKIAEVAVIGMPHPTKKEVPVAIVTLAPGASATDEELLEWCRQNIARYRAPRGIKIIPASEMPYGMTLKILKRKLWDRYAEEYTKKFSEKA